jgi:hypothetical protein
VTETERMPSLGVGNTELVGSKLKRGNSFSKPNSEPLPKPRQVRQVRRVTLWFLGFAFIENSKILRAEYMKSCCCKGAHPGVEAPITPVEPDVLDGGGGVEGRLHVFVELGGGLLGDLSRVNLR